VVEAKKDPQLLAVSPSNFASHLQVIQTTCTPLALRELSAAIRQRRVPHHGVVVTFDDGYADNLEFAKPLLERYHIPGTVFVTSGALDSSTPFWWDELGSLLLGRTDLPTCLAIRIGGRLAEWNLSNPAQMLENSTAGAQWSVLSNSDTTPAQTAYRELCDRVRPLDTEAREAVLASIRQQLGVHRVPRGDSRAMTTAELQDLASGGLMEVGAHTVTHVLLSAVSKDRQVEEIAESKRTLEGIIPAPVDSFSYPFGGWADYSGETVELVKSSGFLYACSNFEGVVTKATDLFQIPRFIVRDWDGPTFAAKLHDWFTRPRVC
jgi:peptidoglycan/xylan/chitin deacetylase (PgdA/CDA1 family)